MVRAESRGEWRARKEWRAGRALSPRRVRPLLFSLLSLFSLALAACDVVEEPADRLVVEAFAETGAALPTITVRRTTALGDLDAAPPVADALVTLAVSGEDVPYVSVADAPGQYRPLAFRATEAGDELGLEVRWEERLVTATTVLPAPITLDSLRIEPAAAPVEAVFADSLGLNLEEGFIYSVDVTLYWTVPEADTAWVRTRLRPPADFPSAVVDVLLETERIDEERAFGAAGGVRSWRGVYAVPVEAASDPLPPHELDVALLRSGEDYARYALSRTDPDRREPIGNVEGGLGIVAGIALDRRTVIVE